MNKQLKKILLMKLTFVSLTIYTNIFVNYFFWQKTGDLKMVILFNIIQWAFWMLPYSIGVYITLKKARWNYFISSSTAVATFALLHLFSDSMDPVLLMVCVAILTTMISTFFYASNTVALVDSATSGKELNRFISLEGSLTNAVSFLMPIVSAFIIHFAGYEWSFLMMVVISVGYFFLTLSSVKPKQVEWETFKKAMKEEKMTLQMNGYTFIGALASRGMLLFGSILLIFISANELQMSLWNGVSVLVILGLAAIIKKYSKITVTQWNRITIVLVLISITIVLMGWDLQLLIILQAIVVYLTRFVEMSLPLKEIRRRPLEGKIVLTYKREMVLTVSRLMMASTWYLVYQHTKIETFFLLVLVSVLISLIVIGVLGKKMED